ncbi:hypothetical protein A8H39_01485 [Paraburkholderia fungorum]|uniref:hypothetical protein n=1 Tax=Paraburkholderia fungorum TaxID=134537 RepID=UPI0004887CF4|nr:hypothetical protein [Paraburkholderia fungorum]MBB5546676.1 hypothetical protein [Paraburkholderia fungorum]PNE59847.1 hypothetical protein A8H39_01485 [Paraburkholderia fungorum]
MKWAEIIARQRSTVRQLFERMNRVAGVAMQAHELAPLQSAYEQESACLRAMGSVLIGGAY